MQGKDLQPPDLSWFHSRVDINRFLWKAATRGVRKKSKKYPRSQSIPQRHSLAVKDTDTTGSRLLCNSTLATTIKEKNQTLATTNRGRVVVILIEVAGWKHIMENPLKHSSCHSWLWSPSGAYNLSLSLSPCWEFSYAFCYSTCVCNEKLTVVII